MSVSTRFANVAGSMAFFALSFATLAVQGQSQPINSSFETPTYGGGMLYPSPSGAGVGWTFRGSSGIRYFASSQGSNGLQAAYLASDGSTATLGTLSQTIALLPGKYQIRYVAARGLGNIAGGETINPPGGQSDVGTLQPI